MKSLLIKFAVFILRKYNACHLVLCKHNEDIEKARKAKVLAEMASEEMRFLLSKEENEKRLKALKEITPAKFAGYKQESENEEKVSLKARGWQA